MKKLVKVSLNEEVTVNDLYNYMEEYEEDPIVDGPVILSDEEEQEFIESLDKDIIHETEFDFLGIGGGQWSQEQMNYLMNMYVDFLNSKGYTYKVG
jgi:hypothetical protein